MPDSFWGFLAAVATALATVVVTLARGGKKELQDRIKEQNATIDKIKEELKDVLSKLSTSVQELEMLQRSKDELEEECNRERRHHENEISRLERCVRGLEQENRDHLQTIIQKSDQIEELGKEINELRTRGRRGSQ